MTYDTVTQKVVAFVQACIATGIGRPCTVVLSRDELERFRFENYGRLNSKDTLYGVRCMEFGHDETESEARVSATTREAGVAVS